MEPAAKRKRAMTAIDVMAWLREKGSFLLGSWIDNVYNVPGTSVLLLKLAKEGARLLIEPASRIYLTSATYPTPKEPSSFVAALRKHLKGARMASVEQVGFDRVLVAKLDNGASVYVELLPRGVVAVVASDGKLLVASEYREMKDRVLRPGLPYKLPPLVERAPTYEECRAALEQGGLGSLPRLGLPREVVDEAAFRNQNDPCSALSEILEEAARGRGFVALDAGEKPAWFGPYEPRLLKSKGFNVKELASFNDALEEYFSFLDKELVALSSASAAASTIARLQKSLEKERETVEAYRKLSLELYESAQLLLEHAELAERALECFKEVRWDGVVGRCPGVVEAAPQRGELVIEVGGRRLKLVVYKSLKEQVKELFEEARKYKSKYEAGLQKLRELEEKIEKELEAAEAAKELATALVRKRAWYERFRWSFTRGGFLVLAGRDASQNESLVRRYLREGDIFLHADVQGAAATILRVEGSEPSAEDLEDAARIAACYSKAWKAGLASVDVFWVKGSQVSLSAPPGEYLPRGSFMIYGKKNFVKGVPLELAVGLQELEGSVRFIVGSPEAVSKNGKLLAVVSPGNAPPERVAKKLVEKLRSCGLKCPPPEELASMLPGKSQIKKLFASA